MSQREDKIQRKLNIYLSRDILLTHVQLGYVYSWDKEIKILKELPVTWFSVSEFWFTEWPMNSR